MPTTITVFPLIPPLHDVGAVLRVSLLPCKTRIEFRVVLNPNQLAILYLIFTLYTHQLPKAGKYDLRADSKRGLLLLDLVIPAPVVSKDKADKGYRTKTILTEHQLLVARDFLALALPYYAEAHPRLRVPIYNSYSDSMRVLITAPEGEGTAADVMSIAVCYLAWASEQLARTVVECIKTEEEVPMIWRGAIGEDEAVEEIGRVARLE
ncbi:hypothetical protein C0992_012781 [Termitomyces sp. T32_za158]|nr:hypothetical protein C0992_012781 [Termitomyces sp. T32_za158]